MTKSSYYVKAGPDWQMVREWLENYTETTKRTITITLLPVQVKGGSSMLCCSIQSYERRGTHEHVNSHENYAYWPSRSFVSLAAMSIRLIHDHAKETEARAATFAKTSVPRDDCSLPF
jgi:hypothetical protein